MNEQWQVLRSGKSGLISLIKSQFKVAKCQPSALNLIKLRSLRSPHLFLNF